MSFRKVLVVGLDGLDSRIVEDLMARGELPHLESLRERGSYQRLATTFPAQTPVAWSTFAVGANPGAHGIFDFLRRDPETYRPEVGLYRHEQKSRFLPPRAVNLRGGFPVWEQLSAAGIPATVLRHPCTYPPAAFKGRLLAGVGVPDLRGGFGTPSFFCDGEDPGQGESERAFRIPMDSDGRSRIQLPGPLLPGGGEAMLELDLKVESPGGPLRISCPDGSFSHTVTPGNWTGWVSVRFRIRRLQSVRGILRFFLLSSDPVRLFASPVQYDPDLPLFPVSHPWDYAGELKHAMGPFATLGMAEEHNGLTNGRIGEDAFLTHALDVMHERRGMMLRELSRFDEGLFYCLFDTPDRVQHMFWRFREPGHPANQDAPWDPDWKYVIEDHYRRCDEIVGDALAASDPETLFLVLSDHGFTSFRRKFHLNYWLHEAGYLVLKNGTEPGPEAGDLLESVDWGRTRAYAVGLTGLYLNLQGREAEGIVRPSEAEGLREEIAGALGGLRDEERGQVAIRRAHTRDAVYSGPFVGEAPDVLLACSPGYRISSATAMGGMGAGCITDNTRRWSGDHAVDPEAVPGILFSNVPLSSSTPHIRDMAPTILAALGAPEEDAHEGGNLIS